MDDYFGLPGMGGYDLGEKFREHAISLRAEIIRENAKSIEKTGLSYKITGKKGTVYETVH